MADQRDVAGNGDGLVLHLKGLERAFAGFDIGDEFLLVLDLAAGMPVGQVIGGQGLKLRDVLVQHGVGQMINGLRNIFVRRRSGGGDVAAEQAEKTNQHFDFFHGCFLVVVGCRTT
ncbi:hypothetical protein D3C71_1141590 [compost metagenome]